MKEMFSNTFLKLNKADLTEFYKYKSNHYRRYNALVVILASLLSIMFYASDCMAIGGFSKETLNIRLLVVVPLIIYTLIYKYDSSENSWKHLATASHAVGHIITWCVVIAAQYLPDEGFINEGFVLMQVVIMMIGIASPF